MQAITRNILIFWKTVTGKIEVIFSTSLMRPIFTLVIVLLFGLSGDLSSKTWYLVLPLKCFNCSYFLRNTRDTLTNNIHYQRYRNNNMIIYYESPRVWIKNYGIHDYFCLFKRIKIGSILTLKAHRISIYGWTYSKFQLYAK